LGEKLFQLKQQCSNYVFVGIGLAKMMFENVFLACGPINKLMTMPIHQKPKSNMYK